MEGMQDERLEVMGIGMSNTETTVKTEESQLSAASRTRENPV